MGILNVTPDSFSDGGAYYDPARAVEHGLADPMMAPVVAAAGIPYVVMHWRAPSRHMPAYAVYRDVVTGVPAELRRRVDALTGAGVGPGRG